MWLLIGITVLLVSRTVIANPEDQNAYYLSEVNNEGVFDAEQKPEYIKLSRTNEDAEQPDIMSLENDRSNFGSDTKRSVIKMDLRDTSSTIRQDPTSLSTLLYWPDGQTKVVARELRINPLIQERKGPTFSPWGGKRNLQRYRTITKIRRPVRVPFNSWGGKRNSENMVEHHFGDIKRTKFFNWGGKKAPPFGSWGGKRMSNIHGFDLFMKHFNELNQIEPENGDPTNIVEGNNGFSSDAAEENYANKLTFNEMREKRDPLKFTADGAITTSTRVPFDPWGGKKRQEFRFGKDNARSASVSLMFRKIGHLFPWTA